MGLGAIPVGILGLLLLSFFVGLLVRRREFELRMRVLELIALSIRRNVPVVPMLRRAASTGRRTERRAFQALAKDIESGEELGEALHWAAPNSFPVHVRAAIEAAQGGPALPGVLSGLAAETDEGMGANYRFSVAFLYPLLLLFMVLAVRELVVMIFASMAGTSLGSPPVLGMWSLRDWIPSMTGVSVSPSVLVTLVVLGGLLLLHTLWRSRPKLRRVLQSLWGQFVLLFGRAPQRDLTLSRFLVTLSYTVEAGTPLPEGLRCAAAAAGDPRLEDRIVRATAALESGMSPSDVWAGVGLPDSVAVRIAAALQGEPAQCAQSLRQVARGRRELFVSARERFLETMQPVAVLLCGIVLALDFAALFSLTNFYGTENGLW